MSAESLWAEVEFAISRTSQPRESAAALITDFLRTLHELMFKSNRDQAEILAQVQAVFGSTTLHHLAKILNAPTDNLRHYALADDALLFERVALNCKQRGFEVEEGFHLLAHFIKALDEERTDSKGKMESVPVMLYWAVGQEAAYHLVGLYVGDYHDVAAIELCGYFDPRLKRFYKLVEIWQMEQAWELEDSE